MHTHAHTNKMEREQEMRMTLKDMRKKQKREEKKEMSFLIGFELAALQLKLEEKMRSVTSVGVCVTEPLVTR